jgi:hypothetical protein
LIGYDAIYDFSYPLLNFSPLPGKIPTKVVLPYSYDVAKSSTTKFVAENNPPSVTDKNRESNSGAFDRDENNINNSDSYQLNNISSLPIPSLPWAKNDAPFVYVQQIILRSVVLPWNNKDLALTDAFRGPLFEVFKLLEIISNHETNVTLSNLCLHVENVKRSHKESLFPEYNCLVLSPANFWKQNIHNFNRDTSLLNTIYQHHVRT